MDERKEELLKIINHDPAMIPLIEEMVYLENELDKLRKLPKIRVNDSDPSLQKTTPAAKLYKEFLQQYTNIVRILVRATSTDEEDDSSPLKKWMLKKVNEK